MATTDSITRLHGAAAPASSLTVSLGASSGGLEPFSMQPLAATVTGTSTTGVTYTLTQTMGPPVLVIGAGPTWVYRTPGVPPASVAAHLRFTVTASKATFTDAVVSVDHFVYPASIMAYTTAGLPQGLYVTDNTPTAIAVPAVFTGDGTLAAAVVPRFAAAAPLAGAGALSAAVNKVGTEWRAYGTASPPTTAAVDGYSVTLGVEFYTTVNANVTKIHFWQPSTGGDGSTRTVGVYNISTGALVSASETLTVSGSGWQTKTLATPIAVVAGTRYRAAVYHPGGQYPNTDYYFSTGPGSVTLANGILRVPSQAAAHNGTTQGCYTYATGIHNPYSTFHATNYWTDVTVT